MAFHVFLEDRLLTRTSDHIADFRLVLSLATDDDQGYDVPNPQHLLLHMQTVFPGIQRYILPLPCRQAN